MDMRRGIGVLFSFSHLCFLLIFTALSLLQVSVEATSGLERRMTVTVPAERIEKEVENRLKSLSRTVRLAGFRPGKVPVKVVATRYGTQVRNEVIGEVTQSSFQEAVTQENLRLAGIRRLWVVSERGLVWSINCDS